MLLAVVSLGMQASASGAILVRFIYTPTASFGKQHDCALRVRNSGIDENL
jgi:hypothetical protein